MKLEKLFFNCINRYSFHFMSSVGMAIFFIPIIYSHLADINDFICYQLGGGLEQIFFKTLDYYLPTYGTITIVMILAIYIALLRIENKIPNFRIKKEFLSHNILFGLIVFVFFIFAFLALGFLLYSSVLLFIFNKYLI